MFEWSLAACFYCKTGIRSLLSCSMTLLSTHKDLPWGAVVRPTETTDQRGSLRYQSGVSSFPAGLWSDHACQYWHLTFSCSDVMFSQCSDYLNCLIIVSLVYHNSPERVSLSQSLTESTGKLRLVRFCPIQTEREDDGMFSACDWLSWCSTRGSVCCWCLKPRVKLCVACCINRKTKGVIEFEITTLELFVFCFLGKNCRWHEGRYISSG